MLQCLAQAVKDQSEIFEWLPGIKKGPLIMCSLVIDSTVQYKAAELLWEYNLLDYESTTVQILELLFLIQYC